MRKRNKGSLSKLLHIFLIVLLCSLLTSCSLKYINIFSLRPSSNDPLQDNPSDTDTNSPADLDELDQAPDIGEEIGDPEDYPLCG